MFTDGMNIMKERLLLFVYIFNLTKVVTFIQKEISLILYTYINVPFKQVYTHNKTKYKTRVLTHSPISCELLYTGSEFATS